MTPCEPAMSASKVAAIKWNCLGAHDKLSGVWYWIWGTWNESYRDALGSGRG